MCSYITCRRCRDKIDGLLFSNARVQSNLGTGSIFDVGSSSAAKDIWHGYLREIRSEDEIFYQSITTIEERAILSGEVSL